MKPIKYESHRKAQISQFHSSGKKAAYANQKSKQFFLFFPPIVLQPEIKKNNRTKVVDVSVLHCTSMFVPERSLVDKQEKPDNVCVSKPTSNQCEIFILLEL